MALCMVSCVSSIARLLVRKHNFNRFTPSIELFHTLRAITIYLFCAVHITVVQLFYWLAAKCKAYLQEAMWQFSHINTICWFFFVTSSIQYTLCCNAAFAILITNKRCLAAFLLAHFVRYNAFFSIHVIDRFSRFHLLWYFKSVHKHTDTLHGPSLNNVATWFATWCS